MTALIWLHGLYCFVVALTFHDNTMALLLGLAVYVVIYAAHYAKLWRLGGADTTAVAVGAEVPSRIITRI